MEERKNEFTFLNINMLSCRRSSIPPTIWSAESRCCWVLVRLQLPNRPLPFEVSAGDPGVAVPAPAPADLVLAPAQCLNLDDSCCCCVATAAASQGNLQANWEHSLWKQSLQAETKGKLGRWEHNLTYSLVFRHGWSNLDTWILETGFRTHFSRTKRTAPVCRFWWVWGDDCGAEWLPHIPPVQLPASATLKHPIIRFIHFSQRQSSTQDELTSFGLFSLYHQLLLVFNVTIFWLETFASSTCEEVWRYKTN